VAGAAPARQPQSRASSQLAAERAQIGGLLSSNRKRRGSQRRQANPINWPPASQFGAGILQRGRGFRAAKSFGSGCLLAEGGGGGKGWRSTGLLGGRPCGRLAHFRPQSALSLRSGPLKLISRLIRLSWRLAGRSVRRRCISLAAALTPESRSPYERRRPPPTHLILPPPQSLSSSRAPRPRTWPAYCKCKSGRQRPSGRLLA